MGICLDTEQHNDPQDERDQDRDGSGWERSRTAAGEPRVAATPPAGKFPMQNTSHVKFETPKVPVIFVLGGPGSGKVTHCDNLMQEKRGVIHINMTDLLQQYAIGNDMQDFGALSSKTVTEVLMLEMKMAPAAKTYLVSGYPRSMRDVAEYSDKIQVVNGVILVNWRQKVLERQIEYGARLGHVVLSLAKMELNNFYKNVMPVADYFDQTNMLMVVNGERNPGEVYKDFRSAVLRVLGSQENLSAAANGVTGAGADGIPGEIVGVEPAPTMPTMPTQPIVLPRVEPQQQLVQADVITVRAQDMDQGYHSPVKNDPPSTLWVIGGPGSNKAALCQRAVTQLPGWAHFSVGRSLRQLAEGDTRPGSDAAIARQSIAGGEMVPQSVVNRLIADKLTKLTGAKGVVIDGYPRDMEQVRSFETTFQQKPNVVLLDCSKLQLGRGRLDDSVAAFRRRLELFRELSLPMLKSLDADQRLTIVDGDTDTVPVQDDFNKVMMNHMEAAELQKSTEGQSVAAGRAGPPGLQEASLSRPSAFQGMHCGVKNVTLYKASTLIEIKNVVWDTPFIDTARSGGINTISQQVQNSGNMINGVKQMANGGMRNGIANGHVNGAIPGMVNGFTALAASKVAPLQANITNNSRNFYQSGIEHLDAHI
ncbi:adenylate kinase isoenzyme 5 [Arctopsyche grandis]|uniref:adenylate kinase isoenzyme 5 n=1 Tax=Arctopsyche grandis TaxID=121162 RepID=UPI00406D8A31